MSVPPGFVVAAVQMSGSDDKRANLARAEELVAEAAGEGAGLVVLPELFACIGRPDVLRSCAEPRGGETERWAARTARVRHVHLLAGSHVEDAHGRLHNTSTLWGPDGTEVAAYRKIHLFDNDVPGAAFRESDTISPGDRRVVATVEDVPVGLTTCYDLRFPELFAALAGDGARVVVVPSAFMDATGRDHWEPLLRARAIENGLFVIAPDQHGSPDGTLRCHGNSMILDPWGRILARAPDSGDAVLVESLDFGLQDEVRARLPSLRHRRPETYM